MCNHFVWENRPAGVAGHDRRRPRRRLVLGGNASGFSLAELIVAMAVGLILLSAVYNLFSIQNKQLSNQEQLAELQQNARMGMDMLVRDIRMAGYNPTGALPDCAGTLPSSLINANCMGLLNADSNVIQLNMDTTNTAGTGPPDGDTDGPNETLTYGLYTSTAGGVSVQCLGRRTTADSSYQPVVENIQSLNFVYLGADGNELPSGLRRFQNIRGIEITLIAKTAKSDPSYAANSGYRTYTLRSVVTPRNLAY